MPIGRRLGFTFSFIYITPTGKKVMLFATIFHYIGTLKFMRSESRGRSRLRTGPYLQILEMNAVLKRGAARSIILFKIRGKIEIFED